jgi:hypothetical protein
MSLLRPYCSVDELRAFIRNDDPEIEDRLVESINNASRYIEDTTGRDFTYHDHATTAYQVKRQDIIADQVILPFEIITLTQVISDGQEQIARAGDYTASYDYCYDAGSRILTHIDSWGSIVAVKGTFGYALAATDSANQPPPTLPGRIKEACKQIAAAMSGLWQKQKVGLAGTESFFVTSVPREVKDLLRPYVLSHRNSF